MASYDENELPKGWVREFDQTHGHPYWVDTQAKPPRAIWTHPYEDEQFLNAHPEIKSRLGKGKGKSSAPEPGPSETDVPAESPPPYDPNDAPRRHSFNGKDKTSSSDMRPPVMPRPAGGSRVDSSSSQAHKRGFFGKIKDKTIGTKEEREEARRQEALLMQRRAEERKRLIAEQRRQQEEWLRQQQAAGPSRVSYQQQPVYAAPFGSPYGRAGYGGYGGQSSYGGYGYGGGPFGGGPFGNQQRRGGAGDLAFPILGGLAGGLLLGDLLGGF
ncbi:hypothetical protein BC629DRAFT_1588777 [Irpex lacteus]|nr:hypothetical protein BC629DRAFT_1588777 [Irpex lacteus]